MLGSQRACNDIFRSMIHVKSRQRHVHPMATSVNPAVPTGPSRNNRFSRSRATMLGVASGLCVVIATLVSAETDLRGLIIVGDAGRRHPFWIEVATTNAAKRQGLMHRRQLPRHRGMLFVFEPPRPARMWMKNTLIPLDMFFVGADHGIQHIHPWATPGSLEIIKWNEPSWAVLELPAGTAERLGIVAGDRVLLLPQEHPDHP